MSVELKNLLDPNKTTFWAIAVLTMTVSRRKMAFLRETYQDWAVRILL